jgi:hypothetical protein
VIPVPYQNLGESVTECSLLESVLESPNFSFEPTDFSLLKSILESTHFSFEPTDLASPHLLETNDLSQSVLATISPMFGMQTALLMIPLSVGMMKQHQVTRIWISVLLL